MRDAGRTVNARSHAHSLPLIPDLEREPAVIVRDAETDSSIPPPPSTRRRQRTRTLSGLGDGSDEYRASLHPVAIDDFNAVDELLAQSFEFSEI